MCYNCSHVPKRRPNPCPSTSPCHSDDPSASQSAELRLTPAGDSVRARPRLHELWRVHTGGGGPIRWLCLHGGECLRRAAAAAASSWPHRRHRHTRLLPKPAHLSAPPSVSGGDDDDGRRPEMGGRRHDHAAEVDGAALRHACVCGGKTQDVRPSPGDGPPRGPACGRDDMPHPRSTKSSLSRSPVPYIAGYIAQPGNAGDPRVSILCSRPSRLCHGSRVHLARRRKERVQVDVANGAAAWGPLGAVRSGDT